MPLSLFGSMLRSPIASGVMIYRKHEKGALMKKHVAALCALAMVGACATTVRQNLAELDHTDPAYNSEACLRARDVAMQHNEHMGTRAAGGMALGLLLGPFGIPIAAMADANAAERRSMINEEVRRRCTTPAAVQATPAQVAAPEQPIVPTAIPTAEPSSTSAASTPVAEPTAPPPSD
jgi:hypothetical protein